MTISPKIDIDRLASEIETLAGFSDAPPPAVTRVLFTSQDLAARDYLKGLFTAVGLDVRVDAVGNIFARWHGGDPSAAAVGTGSHTDAIPHSGRYDGTVGVLGGLEAIRSLQAAGFQPKRSIELLMFTSEEPTRFGMGCIGSRLLSGAIDAVAAAALRDEEGESFEDVRLAAGCKGTIGDARLDNDFYAAFVELHIEQGPLLEQEKLPIGVVTAIAAPAALRVIFDGRGGHAGGVLMRDRADALVAGAELAVHVETAALQLGGEDTVATTGVLDVHPRAINSIPSRVMLEIDVRDIDLARRDLVLEDIRRRAGEIAQQRQQQLTIEMINADPPATCDPAVVGAIVDACEAAGASYKKMISRAYHDSLFMSLIAPTSMIFIPCREGVSHRPDEYSSPNEIAKGVEVLAHSLAHLSQKT